MLRPVSLLPALVAVASLTTWAGAAQPAFAAAPDETSEAALGLTISSLSAATIPRSGPVVVTGSITNNDDQDWSAIKIYAILSDTPMTTEAELRAAVQTPDDEYVAERITDTGFASIAELAPGETTTYSVTVPHRALVREADGVYWFGVHALGESADGRLPGADGRARTFLPQVPDDTTAVDTALVVPIRHEVRHRSDGSLGDVGDWRRTFRQDGQLRSLVELGTAAGSRPITWLVDPAVTDAALALAAGNPPRSLEPTLSDDPDASDDPSPSGEPEGEESPSDEPDASQGADPVDPSDRIRAANAQAADSWVDLLHNGLEGNEILALPYGDVDVSGAADHQPGIYRSAQVRSGTELAPWGLPVSPAVASPTGFLDQAGLLVTEPDTRVIVTDQMFSGRAPTVASTAGHTMVVASSGAASGGPGPEDALTTMAMRQRIVSEAALETLRTEPQPLVVVLPSTWSPDRATGFFDGLDEDWINLTTVGDVADEPSSPVDADRLRMPEREAELELDSADFTAAQRLIRSGDILQNLLTLNDQVAGDVRDEAFTSVSYADRAHPDLSRLAADRSRTWIEQKMQSVEVDAPKAVILSSGSGRFSATVTNRLDEPVTVRLAADADPPLRVRVPKGDLDLAPGARATVLLNASSSAVGIRNVTMELTDIEGSRLGSTDEVPVRSNRVSNVIWLILGTGVALLFGAIVVRLFRRIRASRS